MKDNNYDSILFYLTHGHWPESMKPKYKQEVNKAKNKKKELRKAAEKYFVKNGELHIERKGLENEVKIINEKPAQKSVKEGKYLKMGIEFDWKKVETCESFQVIPKRK